MFSVKTFTWAEKQWVLQETPMDSFQCNSRWTQEASELLCKGSLDPCGVVSGMKIFEVRFRVELTVRPTRLLIKSLP